MMLAEAPGIGYFHTNVCRFCDHPIQMMCQQGTAYCSQFCEDDDQRTSERFDFWRNRES